MSRKANFLDEPLYDYLVSVSVREDELLARLRAETAPMQMATMQIAPDQGQLMALLASLTGARRAIEVGVFTGYSSICVARTLPSDGHLLCCDVSKEWTSIAQRYWKEAGVADRIELVLAPASETLQRRLDAGAAGSYDFAFIDADKENYDNYYELCLQLLRRGGLLVLDNVLWSGRVMNADKEDAETQALHALNQKLHADERVDVSLLPVADGLYLARK
ncbi:MAG: class I SAM-dependent methyltransferase, partial [Gammaproteobacteria bacterium]|nr:class I SAM-dependent methyltransferase [Gammaproteobacteria bacterium]